ncbi:MAG: hypothetical protein RMJ97_08845, partial [Raineya sp.]|nr:hypothetical protein [Raineya sp.]
KRNGNILEEKGHFIPSLFHKGVIVNIPYLKERYQSDLEKILSIFDQHNRTESYHILNVREEDFPEKYRAIIRRLQAAAQEKDLRNKMIAEDDFLTELNEYEERINEFEKLVEQERKKTEQERIKAEQERERAENLEKQILVMVKNALQRGMSIDEIQSFFFFWVLTKVFWKNINLFRYGKR